MRYFRTQGCVAAASLSFLVGCSGKPVDFNSQTNSSPSTGASAGNGATSISSGGIGGGSGGAGGGTATTGGTSQSVTGGTPAIGGSLPTGGATPGGASSTGGSSTTALSPCEKIAGAYQVDGSSHQIFLYIAPSTSGDCTLTAKYAYQSPGSPSVLTWQSQKVTASGNGAGYNCCGYYGSLALMGVRLDLDNDGRLLGTGQVDQVFYISGTTRYESTSQVTIGPMSGSTNLEDWPSTAVPWDKVMMTSARFDRDLAQELKPLTVGSGQWTTENSWTASTDLGSDWDLTRGKEITVDVVPNAVDDSGLPISGGVIHVIDIGAPTTSISFATVPPGSYGGRIAYPRPATCGSSDCLELPDNTSGDLSPPDWVAWQMDATGTTEFSVTCASKYSNSTPNGYVNISPIPEGSPIQTLASTTDSVTGATTYHYGYSNVSRLGVTVAGNAVYLIGAEVH
jgi:hypothetical protein